ncbi:hypothetical protein V8D89_004414 [Ganoderma adspersum]
MTGRSHPDTLGAAKEHRLEVALRDQKCQSNFVELCNHKVVYRRYAGRSVLLHLRRPQRQRAGIIRGGPPLC